MKMTGEELASKELAEWREREAKHSLDIIQKTELELMSMSTKYLVKTHKGEEVIEDVGKELDENESTAIPPLLEALQDTTSRHSSHLFDLNCQICSGKVKEDEVLLDKSSSASSSTAGRKKSSEKPSSASSSSKKSSHSHHHSSRSSDRDRKKDRHEKSRSHHRSSKDDRKHRPDKKKTEVEPEVQASSTNEALPASPLPVVQPVQEKPKEEEPTSTVSIKTPEEEESSPQEGASVVWKGAINTEHGKVNVRALDLTNGSSGESSTDWEMPSVLDVVGRIKPELVWDYVNQNRKTGTRDIVVFKFSPASDGDRKTYASFLSQMYKANRFSVIGLVNKAVKDFYVLPLPKDSPIPLALASLSSGTKCKFSSFFSFFFCPSNFCFVLALDENRTSSLLLGVVVRSKRKRTGEQAGAVPSKAAKTAKLSAKSTPPPTTAGQSPSLNYIPTSRAKRTTRDQGQKGPAKADDAPYSPGQLLAEEAIPAVEDGLLEQQAMLEDLNRRIEAEKQELAAMSAGVTSSHPEVMIPGLGEPVIPGLGEPSTSAGPWASDTRVTPHTDPPFDHTAAAPASLNNLNISNLQVNFALTSELNLTLTL